MNVAMTAIAALAGDDRAAPRVQEQEHDEHCRSPPSMIVSLTRFTLASTWSACEYDAYFNVRRQAP
jgi:hypothetical protein